MQHAIIATRLSPPVCADTVPVLDLETAPCLPRVTESPPTMPAKILHSTTVPVLLVLGSMMLAETVATMLLTGEIPAPDMEGVLEFRASHPQMQSTLWADRTFIGLAVLSSMMGGVLAVALLPADTGGDPVRRICLKMACSAICGILFAPSIMVWREVPFTDINVMAWIGGTSFVSVTTIRLLTPYYERAVKAIGEARSPKTDK